MDEEAIGKLSCFEFRLFFRREWARMAANLHEWHSWGKAIYQSGGRGRAKRPGEPMGRTDAGNRPGSVGTPRPTGFQSRGAEEPGRGVVRASTRELSRVLLRGYKSQGGTTLLSCWLANAGALILRRTHSRPSNCGKAKIGRHCPRKRASRATGVSRLHGLPRRR